MDSDWERLKRIVLTHLPAFDPSAGTNVTTGRPLTPDRTGTFRWPANQAEIEKTRTLATIDTLQRKDSQLYALISQLNAFEWFMRLSETITFAIAGSVRPESFLKSELAIIGSAVRESTLQSGDFLGSQPPLPPPATDARAVGESDEYFYIVMEGLLSLQYGRRIAGFLYPGQMWASFTAAAGVHKASNRQLEVRAMHASTLLVVTRERFMAVMAARSDAHFRYKLDFIASVPLLHGLDRKVLRPFVDKLSVELAHKDTVLIKQGEPPAKLYFVLSGEARVLRHVPELAFARVAELAAHASATDSYHSAGKLSSLQDAQGDDRMLVAAAVGHEEAALAAVLEGAEHTEPGPRLSLGSRQLASGSLSAEGGSGGGASGALHAARSPLEIPGRTLELSRLGPHSFFGEIAILNVGLGGRALASVVTASDMRLLSIEVIDFKNAIDATMEAVFRQNARTYPTDAELVSAMVEGAHWRRYKTTLVRKVVQEQRQPTLSSETVGDRPRRQTDRARASRPVDVHVRSKFFICPDGFATPIPRADLFDMAVRSARKASSGPRPSAIVGGSHSSQSRRPPPMLSLPEIVGGVNDSAARAGISHSGSRVPRVANARLNSSGGSRQRASVGGAQSGAHWVDDPKQWDKFKTWGASQTSRDEYKARFEKHLHEATDALVRQSLEAV